jgi:hypothetical protein
MKSWIRHMTSTKQDLEISKHRLLVFQTIGLGIRRAISKPRWQIALLLAMIAFCMGATLSLARWPVPFVHDEFSYLLAADTFCEGRLTNPTHPYWQHFESFHIIHQPSYSSKYPPGQGAFLALGKFFTGHAIAGIWLLSACAAAACYWMLLGWLSPRWAALGGILFILHPGYQLLWGQSYYGGTLSFLGGSLVCGASVRLTKSLQVNYALAMGLGATLLAASRPYEGLVFCVLCGLMVVVGWYRLGFPDWKSLFTRTVIPMVGMLVVGGLALGSFNKHVTGSFTEMPYQVHENTYTIAPIFLWQDLAENHNYRHEIIAQHHQGWMMKAYNQHDSLFTLLQLKANITEMAYHFYLPLPFAICLMFLLPIFWRCKKRTHFWHFGVLGIVFLSWLASMLTAVRVYPHYLAPMAPLLLLITLWGLRNAYLTCRYYLPRYKAQWLLAGFLLCMAILFGYRTMTQVTASKEYWPWKRANIQARLEETTNKHLIFVRYDHTHDSCYEWVYNRANIDQSQVVWAREMGTERDQILVDYFHDRKVWLLEADAANPLLQAYPKSIELASIHHVENDGHFTIDQP